MDVQIEDRPAIAGISRLDAPAGPGRRDRARRRRRLGDLWCHRAVPCLVGEPPAGRSLLVVEWPGTDARFLDLVAAAALRWDLTAVVLGTTGPGTAAALGRDVVDSSGAAALARTLGRRLGRAPDWDVQPSLAPVTAVLRYVQRHRPGLVAVPHGPHGRAGACRALDLAARLDVPVLLV